MKRGTRSQQMSLGRFVSFVFLKNRKGTFYTYISVSDVFCYIFFIDWFLSFFAFLSNISGQLRRAFSVHSCTTFLLSLSIVFFVGCFLFYNHWFVFCVLCTMLGIVAGLLPDISVCTTHRGQRTKIIKLHIFTQNSTHFIFIARESDYGLSQNQYKRWLHQEFWYFMKNLSNILFVRRTDVKEK